MDIPKHVFSHDVVLVNLGDVHRGDNACNVEALRKNVKRIRESDNTFWVSTGDLLNCATKDSKTGPYNSLNIDDEMEELRKDLRHILDKCLGIVESNHHNRVKRAVGINLDKLLAREFDIPYLGQAAVINITCGRMTYYVALHHGCGGGRTMGAKANGIARLEEVFPGCDLYLEGHTHTHLTWRDIQNAVDRKRGKIRQVEATFSVTGHYLDYFRSYAPSLKLRPKPIGSAAHRLRCLDIGNEVAKDVKVEFWAA